MKRSLQLEGAWENIFKIILAGLVFVYSIFMEQVNFEIQRPYFLQGSGESLFVYLASKAIILFLAWILIGKLFQIVFYREYKWNLKDKIWLFYIIVNITIFIVLRFFGEVGSQFHGDMETVLEGALNLKIISYQGWYATIFYTVVAMLTPINFIHEGLVLFQLFFLTYGMAKVLTYLKENYGRRVCFLCGIVFLLPPVLFFVQFPLRTVWFAFALIMLLISYDEVRLNGNCKMKFCFWACIAASLRPEAVYIIGITGLVILLNKRFAKERARLLVFVLGFYFILLIPQNNENGYKSTPFIKPLFDMLTDEQFEWCDEVNDKEVINKIFNIEKLKAHDSLNEIRFASEAINGGFTNKEYISFVKTYVKLVIKNMDIFLRVRWNTFWDTIGGDTSVYGANWINGLADHFGLGKYPGFFSIICNFNIYLVYNSLIPLTLLTVLGIVLFFREKSDVWFSWSVVVGEAVFIFLLVTETQYMFHIQFYIPAYVGAVLLFGRISKVENRILLDE